MSIPLHLIAGSLGSGKTTAIRRFVASSGEYTAVLVNDFGRAGYDASLIAEEGAGRLRVENVPGGCLCCSSAAQLLPALETMRSRPEVRRIMIEPSGLALLDPLLEMLHGAAARLQLDLRPVTVLFDPAKARPAAIRQVPYWRHLVDRAGIAVLNRCDLASPRAVDDLYRCLEEWDPPKLRILKTSHGELPAEVLDIAGAAAPAQKGHASHAELPPAGTFRSDALFNCEALTGLLTQCAPELARFKGTFLTDRGWFRLEIAGNHLHVHPAAGAAGSSAEWIGAGDEMADRINTCVIARV